MTDRGVEFGGGAGILESLKAEGNATIFLLRPLVAMDTSDVREYVLFRLRHRQKRKASD